MEIISLNLTHPVIHMIISRKNRENGRKNGKVPKMKGSKTCFGQINNLQSIASEIKKVYLF